MVMFMVTAVEGGGKKEREGERESVIELLSNYSGNISLRRHDHRPL